MLTKKLVSGTDVTIDFQNIRESSDSPFATLNPSYESTLEMTLTQPLLKNFFGMNDWGEVRITKIDVNNFDSEVLDDVEESLGEVEKAYWDVVVSKRLVEVGEEMYERADEFYKINRKKKQLGTSELTDLLAAEANKRTRETELDVEKDALKTAINKLKLLINVPETDKDVLPLETIEIGGKKIHLISALKTAFEKRRDYERAKREIKAKKIKFNMKKNARWPQLDLEGSLKLNGVEKVQKDAAADAFTHENPEYTAKVTFSIPLEDSKARSEYDAAKHEKAKALLNLKKVERTIVTEVDDIARKVNLNRDKAKQRIEIEELQRKKLEEEEEQFGFGRSDSDKIIRFQEDLLQAKILTLKAFRDYKGSLVDFYLTKDTFLEKRSLAVQ